MTTALVSLALFLALPALAGWIVAGIRRNSAKRLCIFDKVRTAAGRVYHILCARGPMGTRCAIRDAWHGECF